MSAGALDLEDVSPSSIDRRAGACGRIPSGKSLLLPDAPAARDSHAGKSLTQRRNDAKEEDERRLEKQRRRPLSSVLLLSSLRLCAFA
jgi:hypothetical protein